MEEKERYELICYCSYRDTETGVIGDNFVDILNQQDKEIIKLRKENQQLRQQLNELPKKIVEEIRDVLNGNDIEIQDNIYFTDFLDTILKKYGGENESK